MMSAGLMSPKIGPRITTACGCASLSSGVLFAGAAVAWRNEPLFLASYGALFGLGAGMGFTGPVAVLHAWMPEQKGLASGIVTAGFGAGTLIFARIQHAAAVSSTVLLPGVGDVVVSAEMPSFFLRFGLVYITMQIAGLILLQPPENAAAHASQAFSAPPKLA